MTIPSLGNAIPSFTNSGKPEIGSKTPAEILAESKTQALAEMGAKEVKKNQGAHGQPKIEKQGASEKVDTDTDKTKSLKSFLADRVSISPEGMALSKDLLDNSSHIKSSAAEAKKPESKETEPEDNQSQETKDSGAASAPTENSDTPATREARQGGSGGGNEPGEQDKKLEELKKKLKEIEAEMSKLKTLAAIDEAAKAELDASNMEKQAIEAQIQALEGQMQAAAAQDARA